MYDGPAAGDATLRASAGESLASNHCRPNSRFSRKDDADLVAQTTLREGRQLFADRHCGSCHALPGKVAEKDCKMPELASKAPRLGTDLRLHADWIAAWILDPRSLRRGDDAGVLRGADARRRPWISPRF